MHEPNLKQIQKEYHGSLKSYFVGFTASVVLSVASFGLVIAKAFSTRPLIYAIVALALIQAAFQLRFFLKLGHEDKPRWETLMFCFMFFVLLIIAIGSIWIMSDLDARLMPDMAM
jgi:cytochrome o ubiquinol oxidase operon protein cyoD